MSETTVQDINVGDRIGTELLDGRWLEDVHVTAISTEGDDRIITVSGGPVWLLEESRGVIRLPHDWPVMFHA